MIEKKDVEKLADLARINVSDSEKQMFIKDLDSILAYVSEVQDVVADKEIKPDYGYLMNVNLRDDVNPHESSKYTKEIMENVPDAENGYLKVKKIL